MIRNARTSILIETTRIDTHTHTYMGTSSTHKNAPGRETAIDKRVSVFVHLYVECYDSALPNHPCAVVTPIWRVTLVQSPRGACPRGISYFSLARSFKLIPRSTRSTLSTRIDFYLPSCGLERGRGSTGCPRMWGLSLSRATEDIQISGV